jgi:hypothetical protein
MFSMHGTVDSTIRWLPMMNRSVDATRADLDLEFSLECMHRQSEPAERFHQDAAVLLWDGYPSCVACSEFGCVSVLCGS